MADKFDSFGIGHRDNCEHPNWRTLPRRANETSAQRCASCKVIWRSSDGQLTPRPATYGKKTTR